MRYAIRWLAITAVIVSCVSIQPAPADQGDEGLYATIDLLFLSPKLSNTGIGNIFYYDNAPSIISQDGSVASELDFSQRLTLGYEGDQGGGAQVRWFTFDNTLDYVGTVDEGGPPILLSGGLNIDVDAIDAEIVQRGNFRVWDWIATAGARYARASVREEAINFEDLSDIIWFGSTGVQFEGAGPTVSVGGEREVIWEGFSIFARGRTALLYGDTTLWSAFRNGGVWTNHDDFVQAWELQLGVQMEHEYENVDCLMGIFWEAQRWDSDSQLLGDLGFHGFGVRTGFEY